MNDAIFLHSKNNFMYLMSVVELITHKNIEFVREGFSLIFTKNTSFKMNKKI